MVFSVVLTLSDSKKKNVVLPKTNKDSNHPFRLLLSAS